MKNMLRTLIVFLLCKLSMGAKTDNYLLLRSSEEASCLLYDSTRLCVIDTLKHDFQNENYIMLRVDSNYEDMIYVEPIWTLGFLYESTPHKKGWVYLSEDIIIFPHDDIFPLYAKPSYTSDSIVVDGTYSELQVLKYNNGWIYTVAHDTIGGEFAGWLPPLHQCANPYTTCN